MGLFLAIIVTLGYFISYYYQSPIIFYIAIIFSVVMNIGSYWYSDKIALSLSQAKPASRQEYFNLYTVTENLSITAGLPMPRLFVINDASPNAFATGRNKEHAAVAVTTGLLEKLERSELEGVIAHELSHIGNRDILLMSVVVTLVGLAAIASDIFVRSLWFGGNRRDSRNNGSNWIMIIGLIFIILSPIIATLIKLAISRKREYLADASAALLTRYPEGLARALEKIGSYQIPMKKVSTATAHLFISDPLKKGSSFSNLFQTHPPIADRVRLLRQMG